MVWWVVVRVVVWWLVVVVVTVVEVVNQTLFKSITLPTTAQVVRLHVEYAGSSERVRILTPCVDCRIKAGLS